MTRETTRIIARASTTDALTIRFKRRKCLQWVDSRLFSSEQLTARTAQQYRREPIENSGLPLLLGQDRGQ